MGVAVNGRDVIWNQEPNGAGVPVPAQRQVGCVPAPIRGQPGPIAAPMRTKIDRTKHPKTQSKPNVFCFFSG